MCLPSRRNERRFAFVASLIVLLTASPPTFGASSPEPSQPAPTPERLLDEARQAEVAGDTARQFALLREAVRIDPNYELARWQLGQVRVGDAWLAVEDTQRTAAANPKQTAYRELCAENREQPDGQLTLARWCRKNGLDDEARFHWQSVLADDPNNGEAIRALGLRWNDGQLVSRGGLDEARAERIEARRSVEHWNAQVAKWQRVLSHNRREGRTAALDAIRDLTDPAAVKPMEAITLANAEANRPSEPWRQQMALAFISALESMNQHAATESLVRHAVMSPDSEVRTAATEQLRHRSQHDFVPILLDGLSMPVESSFHVATDVDGSVHYLHKLYREGSHNDWSHQITRAALPQASDRQIVARLSADVSQGALAADARSVGTSARSAMQFSNRFGQEAVVAERQVAAMNQAAAVLNERIIPVLKQVTGKDLGDEPRAWWKWWTDETDYYQQEHPVYETSDATYAQYLPPTIPAGSECFAAGTLVWTKTGQQPIEKLEIGDLVLAQDVNTGELAYKPVLGRTVRPPSALLKFTLGREQLITTKGHPMWVAGVGWRMAKELGDGATLHGITGSARVESMQESEKAEAYNLIVADFNTYFVGEQGILVHDNTPRRPTRATVPGLAAK